MISPPSAASSMSDRQNRLEAAIRDASRRAKPVTPFHWEIEFPEVFDRENPGFDAFVGNPPFLGGKHHRSNTATAISILL